ncbi:MAG: O-antigen ligase family protein [Candidatus Omnitrophica bacterium]|nr:O-antigen ligase family protein [Candidatus Omnitrophota bacterium]
MHNLITRNKYSISQYLLFLYLFLVPFMKVPKFAFMGDKIQYCDLVFIPLFFILLISVLRKKIKLVKDSKVVLLILLAVLATVSLFNSPVKSEVYFNVAGMIYLICVYFVITNLVTDKKTLYIAIFIFSITLLFISILGILFFILFNFFNINSLSFFMYGNVTDIQSALLPFSRSSSLLCSPEMYVNFTVLGVSCMSIYYAATKKYDQRVLGISTALVLVGIILAFSRSFVGVLLVLSAVTFLFRKRSRLLYFIFIICVCLFIVLVLSAIFLWFFTVMPVSFSVDKSTGYGHIVFNTGWDTRYYLAKAALRMGVDHPFLGYGLGSFTNNFSLFMSQADLSALMVRRGVPLELLRIDPHSLYFGVIAEMGFLGLIMLMCFFTLILSKLWKATKLACGDRIMTLACYVYFFCIIGYLINGFFADVLSMRFLWVSLSLGVASANITREESCRG